jgi:hypothetical protein
MLMKLTVLRGSADAVTFVMFPSGKSYRRRSRAVTIVTFVVTHVVLQRMIPSGRELGAGPTSTKSVGAFPAHPRRHGGAGDVAGAPERDDEGDLFVPRPPIMAGSGDLRVTGCLLGHRPG